MFAFTSGSFVNRPRLRGLKVDEMNEGWTERRCSNGLSRSSQQRQDRSDEDSNRHRAQTEVVERDSAGQTGRRGLPCVHGDLSKDGGRAGPSTTHTRPVWSHPNPAGWHQGRSFRTERKECTRRANRDESCRKSKVGCFSAGKGSSCSAWPPGLTTLRITEKVSRVFPDPDSWPKQDVFP